jgi:hypothetical protein
MEYVLHGGAKWLYTVFLHIALLAMDSTVDVLLMSWSVLFLISISFVSNPTRRNAEERLPEPANTSRVDTDGPVLLLSRSLSMHFLPFLGLPPLARVGFLLFVVPLTSSVVLAVSPDHVMCLTLCFCSGADVTLTSSSESVSSQTVAMDRAVDIVQSAIYGSGSSGQTSGAAYFEFPNANMYPTRLSSKFHRFPQTKDCYS